tara:strand:- start:9930 stop:10181 length:252 start_codon:yes stop_codon:yes gene_type:complete
MTNENNDQQPTTVDELNEHNMVVPMDEDPNFIASIGTYAQAKERMDICQACPKLKVKTICSICKCFMPAKTWMANESCPDGKW